MNNFIAYMLYLMMVYFGFSPKLSMSLLYFAGAIFGYFGNKSLTFAHSGSFMASGFRYCIAHGVGYLLNISIFMILVDRLGWPHQWVQLGAIFLVASVLFIAFKYFVFQK